MVAHHIDSNISRNQLLPMDLSKEPEIASALARIETAELLSEQ